MSETEDSGVSRAPSRRSFLGGLGSTLAGIVGSPASHGAEQGTDLPPAERPGGAGSLESVVDEQLGDLVGELTPGATVAVVADGRPVLTRGYGYADTAAATPVRGAETAFRVGSVGKLLTWTAVMQGVEAGRLALDTDVGRYLDASAVGVPETGSDPITLRHLGTHTAGFESALDPGIVRDSEAIDPLETVLVEHRPSVVRQPGAAVGYSNYGAALAGHVVAETADTTFEEYVQSELFEPLGMRHSTFAQPRPASYPGTTAVGHVRENGSFTPAEEVYLNMRPAGSLSATASDMARFMCAHLRGGAVDDGRILDASTVERMHSVHHVRHPAVNNWRYGFYEYGAPGSGLLAHSGATVNFESLLVLAPAHDAGVFLSVNRSVPPRRLRETVEAILDELGARPEPAPVDPTATLESRARARAVTGEYGTTMLPDSGPMAVAAMLGHLTVELTDEGRLRTRQTGGEPRDWVETAPYVFRDLGGRDVLAFEMAGDEVATLNVSRTQQGVYEPVAPSETQAVSGAVLGGSLSGFALALAGQGGRAVWHRMDRSEQDTGGEKS